MSWYEALAYTRWLEERLPAGWRAALPSEAEWEKAARGGEEIPAQKVIRALDELTVGEAAFTLIPNRSPQREFPWEEKFDPNRANTAESGIGATSAVGCFSGGAGPYGAEELSGNVCECTRSLNEKYPYQSKDGRETLDSTASQALRGGTWYFNERNARCSARNTINSDNFYWAIGFRVVVRPPFPAEL